MKIEILNTAEVTSETKEQGFSFNKITKDQAAVYGILCPIKHDYDIEQIKTMVDVPDRIKQLADMTCDRFYKFQIWEAESYEVKDPILLGRVKDPNNPTYTWNDSYFFLARWGSELENFSILKQKAIQIFQDKSILEAMKIKAQIDMFLQNPVLFSKMAIEDNKIEIPSLNFNIVRF